MVIRINEKTVTAIGRDRAIVTDSITGALKVVTGMNGVIGALFKSDKGMKDLLKSLLPNKEKYKLNEFEELKHNDYMFKKLAVNSYMLSENGKDIEEFNNPIKGLEYLFNLILFSTDKTILKIEKLINHIDKLNREFILLINKD